MAALGHSYGQSYEERTVVRNGGKGNPCQQLGCSLLVSALGAVMFWGSLYMIGCNEKSSVCISRALIAASESHTPVSCEGGEGSSGDAVFFSCKIEDVSMPAWTPSDFGAGWLKGAFNTKAVKLDQKVEMYQCREIESTRTEKENDKDVRITTYTYKKEWSGTVIESNQFKAWGNTEAKRALESGCGRDFRENPSFPMESDHRSSDTLYAGAYDLTRHLKSVPVDSPVAIKIDKYKVPRSFARAGRRQAMEANPRRVADDGAAYTYDEFIDYYGDRADQMWAKANPVDSKELAADDGSVVVRGNMVQTCSALFIGCVRISYFESAAKHVSHLAALNSDGRTTRPWVAPASWMCSTNEASNQVDLFSVGRSDPYTIVADAQAANNASMWLFRFVGIVLTIVGVQCFLQPIQTIADLVDQFCDWFKFIPILGWGLDFLGNVVSGTVGCAITLVSLGIGLPASFFVLSVAWCIMRPLIGIPMVLLALAGIAYTIKAMVEYAKIGKEKRQNKKTT